MFICKMASSTLPRVLVLFLVLHCLLAEETQRHTKFEYKYSFKGPHLVNKQGNIPFWTYGGSAIPGDEQVRLTPSLRDKKGYMWTKNKFESEWWEIEVIFRVTGRGRVGADGLGIWFTEEQGQEGPVFGSSDNWNGLAILCDSFDNDGEQNNPFISVVVNDKTKSYDHHSDGSSQHQGGCLRDFRNKPHPVRVKARYFNNILTTWFHNGMSTKTEDYELCTRVENVNLPKTGYFGLSAATGGLADDHDALALLTHSISMVKKDEEEQKKKDAQKLSEEEQKKYSEQYEEYAQKLEKQKEEYAKQHPDKAKRPDAQYETGYDRDVRLVYEGQNVIHQMITNLHNKVGELTVQINALQTLVTSDHSKVSHLVSKDDTINREEVNTLVNLQHQLANKLEGIKSSLQGGGIQRRDTGDSDEKINSIKTDLENIMHNVNHLVTQQQFISDKAGKEKQCPPPPDMPQCIGPGYFVFLIVAQLTMMMGYIIYRNQKESSAKKFF